jgi:HK97 family phage prohead protease
MRGQTVDYLHSAEFKFRDIKAGTVAGYGSVFGNVDHGLDRIEAGAFRKSIMGRRSLPMLHEHRDPIGVWSTIAEDDHGLKVAGKISDTQLGRDVRTLAKDGAITGLSIGYTATRHRFEGQVRVLEEVELHEVSLVTFPMNQLAQVTSAKSQLARGDIPALAELELLLRNAGLSRRQAKRLLRHGYAGMTPAHTAAALLEGMADRLSR